MNNERLVPFIGGLIVGGIGGAAVNSSKINGPIPTYPAYPTYYPYPPQQYYYPYYQNGAYQNPNFQVPGKQYVPANNINNMRKEKDISFVPPFNM